MGSRRITKMKISRYNGQECRLVLTGMVTDPIVCSRVASMKMNGTPLFGHPWADMISKWCIDHMKRYNTPPKANIEQMFRDWAATSPTDKDTIDSIEKF